MRFSLGATKAPLRQRGVVVQLVRISACHAEGRGFESRLLRQNSRPKVLNFGLFYFSLNQLCLKYCIR